MMRLPQFTKKINFVMTAIKRYSGKTDLFREHPEKSWQYSVFSIQYSVFSIQYSKNKFFEYWKPTKLLETLKHKKSRYKLYRLLKYIRIVNDYLPSSIFFFNAARPPISPKVVFSASAAFLTATFTFLFSCSLNKDV